jgi:hypothetical protein
MEAFNTIWYKGGRVERGDMPVRDWWVEIIFGDGFEKKQSFPEKVMDWVK